MMGFSYWWFIHGGSIHRLWKSKSYSAIKELALTLPKEAYEVGFAEGKQSHRLTEEQKNKLIDRFLAWPLPKSVCSDKCVSDPTYPNRVGTNLLTADEAKQMLDYLFEEKKL